MQTYLVYPNTGRCLTTVLALVVWSVLCIACLWPSSVEGREALVVWSCSPEEDVAGYVIHYGPSSRDEAGFTGYPNTIRLEKDDFVESQGTAQYRLKGLDDETTYWFAMTAFDHSGNESDFSNEKVLSPQADPEPHKELGSGGGGGCQTAQASRTDPSSWRSGLPGWLLVWVGVPFWILWVRRLTVARV